MLFFVFTTDKSRSIEEEPELWTQIRASRSSLLPPCSSQQGAFVIINIITVLMLPIFPTFLTFVVKIHPEALMHDKHGRMEKKELS